MKNRPLIVQNFAILGEMFWRSPHFLEKYSQIDFGAFCIKNPPKLSANFTRRLQNPFKNCPQKLRA
jgi:hypothetical protein